MQSGCRCASIAFPKDEAHLLRHSEEARARIDESPRTCGCILQMNPSTRGAPNSAIFGSVTCSRSRDAEFPRLAGAIGRRNVALAVALLRAPFVHSTATGSDAQSFPTTFLPTFASNGRIYAFSAIWRLEPICLNVSEIGGCTDSAC